MQKKEDSGQKPYISLNNLKGFWTEREYKYQNLIINGFIVQRELPAYTKKKIPHARVDIYYDGPEGIGIKKINGKSLIEIMLHRLKKSKYINKIVFAIPNNKENHNLYNFLKKLSCNIHLGNEKNVLKRFFYTAKKFNADNIVRITSDCPLVDYQLVDKMLKFFLKSLIKFCNFCRSIRIL